LGRLFGEQVVADVDFGVGIDADEEVVEGCAVQLADRQAVGNFGLYEFLAVSDDVSCVEELFVAQAADRAAPFVGLKDGRAEAILM